MFKRLALLFPALALSACVVVIGDDDADVHFDDEETVIHSTNKQHKHNFALSNRIEDAIRADQALQYADINVSNTGQAVTLHGEVFESSHIQHAVNIALADSETNTVSSRIILTIEK